MDETINLLRQWQTLLGAFLGGIFSLSVALLVAYSSRRFEERAAAMLLIGDLLPFMSAVDRFKDSETEKRLSLENQTLLLGSSLVYHRPKLSPMFQASMFRVMPRDVHLAAHLNLTFSIVSSLEFAFERLAKDAEILDAKIGKTRETAKMKSDIEFVKDGYELTARHAACAVALLEGLILSRIRIWNRIKGRFHTSTEQKGCMDLLESGELPRNTEQRPRNVTG